jgi:tetratricopeptide (TPR) repeat protein
MLAGLFCAAHTFAAGSGDPDRPVSDDDDKRARELFIKADRMYAEGDYESALEAFSEAYELSGRPPLLYNMANAHERLGEYDKALERLRAYFPHASKHQQELLEKRMQSLQMRADEQRAKKEEEAKEREAERKADRPPQREAKANASAEPGIDTKPPPYLGYVLMGAGALGLGLGTYFGTQALDARSEAKDLCPEVNGAQRCTEGAKDAIDRDRSRSLMADVSFGVGVASAAVGVILVLRHGSDSEPAPAPALLRAGPRSGGGQVDFVMRF